MSSFRTASPSVDAAGPELLSGLAAAPMVDGMVTGTAVSLPDLLPRAPLGAGPQQLQRPIVIIDDHREIRDLIAQTLSDEGYQVETYSDAETALRRIEASQPGLVLLDLMMPRMSGWQMINALRDRFGAAHVPVVLLSASRELRQTAERFGVDYLSKPFNLNDLLLLVERVLGLPL